MIGAIWGAAVGIVQFFIIKRLADAITSGGRLNTKTILLVLLQMPIMILGLLLCALIMREDLVYCGIAMGAVIVASAFTVFIKYMRRNNKK